MASEDEPLTPVEDWLRVHRELMAKEAAFPVLAMRAAAGEVTLEELDAERSALMSLRALCTAMYEKAFPKPPKADAGTT